jgi:hypothetical protein
VEAITRGFVSAPPERLALLVAVVALVGLSYAARLLWRANANHVAFQRRLLELLLRERLSGGSSERADQVVSQLADRPAS